MVFTALDAKNFCAKYVADGRDPADPFVLQAINEVIQILVNEGDWKHLVQKMRFQINNDSISLPSYCETILKAYHADDSHFQPSRIWSMGYEMLDAGPGPFMSANDHEWVDLIDLGDNWATMFPVGTVQRNLVAFSSSRSDEGKKIRVKGRDDHHRIVNPSGSGEEIDIVPWDHEIEGHTNPDSIKQSTFQFIEIDQVIKPVTDGYISLYAYQSSDHAMWTLGKYHPHETQPGFRRYKLTGRFGVTTADSLTCLVKLRYAPLIVDTDIPIIQSLPALRIMCQSLHARNMGDSADALAKQGDAMRMLDKQLKNAHPETNEFDVQMSTSFGDMPEIN